MCNTILLRILGHGLQSTWSKGTLRSFGVACAFVYMGAVCIFRGWMSFVWVRLRFPVLCGRKMGDHVRWWQGMIPFLSYVQKRLLFMGN